jgi:Uma2 family endonuclease
METPEITVREPQKIEIPEALVYEMMDGKPIPYRGFEAVLNQEKEPEDIIGSSGLQSIIVSAILRHLFRVLPEEKYEIVTNEAGLHLDKNNNLSTDIGIYLSEKLPVASLTNHYLNIPPQLAIEVDTKASMVSFNDPADYYHKKTQKLLDFGVEMVIWIFSESKKVMSANAGEDWITADWHKEINLLNGVMINLSEILKKRGIDA